MKLGSAFRLSIAVAALAVPVGAMAQASWVPPSEVLGQPIQVTTNGITNTLYLDAGGVLRVYTPGGTLVQGTWTAENGQLCLFLGGQQECIPYDSPFNAGEPRTVTSSCNVVQVWVAQATNNSDQSNGQGGR